jgi:hypothetical protein
MPEPRHPLNQVEDLTYNDSGLLLGRPNSSAPFDPNDPNDPADFNYSDGTRLTPSSRQVWTPLLAAQCGRNLTGPWFLQGKHLVGHFAERHV